MLSSIVFHKIKWLLLLMIRCHKAFSDFDTTEPIGVCCGLHPPTTYFPHFQINALKRKNQEFLKDQRLEPYNNTRKFRDSLWELYNLLLALVCTILNAKKKYIYIYIYMLLLITWLFPIICLPDSVSLAWQLAFIA